MANNKSNPHNAMPYSLESKVKHQPLNYTSNQPTFYQPLNFDKMVASPDTGKSNHCQEDSKHKRNFL